VLSHALSRANWMKTALPALSRANWMKTALPDVENAHFDAPSLTNEAKKWSGTKSSLRGPEKNTGGRGMVPNQGDLARLSAKNRGIERC